MNSVLPLGVFVLKLIEWWYSTESSAAVRMMTSLPVPPPPPHTQVSMWRRHVERTLAGSKVKGQSHDNLSIWKGKIVYVAVPGRNRT